jgi:hypothetical protein
MSSHLPSINKNSSGYRDPNRKPEKTADLEYEKWRQDMIYKIYGNQNPPTKTYRGRVF